MSGPTVDPDEVAERLAEVRRRIAAAGGDPWRVTVVAVTKGLGAEAVTAAGAAGLRDVGENYAQELLGKQSIAPVGMTWHFIGSVQRNKTRRLAPVVDVWQTVDRLPVGSAIATAAPGARVMVQVNSTGEASKGGCTVEEAPALVEALRAMDLSVIGLMTVGPAGPPGAARAAFATVAALARHLEVGELSMGMTLDLDVAVQEGATMVRIGTGLFGPRRVRPATIG
jgi:pyridoxal phosphate enzyme (YggS family)